MRDKICCGVVVILAYSVLTAQTSTVARPQITGIAHMGLAAQSLEADKRFYVDTLGWTAAKSLESPGGMRFSGDGLQSVEVAPVKTATEAAFNHLALATSDVAQMRLYLAAKGIEVPAALTTWSDGTQSFRIKDPEGNAIEFVQSPRAASGPHNSRAISSRMIHAGFVVHSASAENRFYRDILGFRLYWTGGMKDGVTDFVSLQVPDGTDWIEYMLNVGPHPSHREVGVYDHFSLGVVSIDDVVAQLSARGWKATQESMKQMGRDGKYQLNIYDPDDVRVEYMEFSPKQKPCCAPFTGPHPQPPGFSK